MAPALLEIERLSVDLKMKQKFFRVIHDVTASVSAGQAVGLVGESGSGKSMTSKAIMRLLPDHSRVRGRLEFGGRAIHEMTGAELREFRRHGVGMIYQEPKAHINPVRTVGDFLIEGLRDSDGLTRRQARARAIEALADVGIPDGHRRLRQYPHQLSGGLLQRVMIASVLLAEPALVIADEPTTALDVTTQEEVVAILDERRRERDMALIFITHDLDLAIAITDRISVMYAGMVVESAPAKNIETSAIHPYTKALLDARPRIDRTERLRTVPGRAVSGFEVGPGCVFAGRCPHADGLAQLVRPEPRPMGEHSVACHRADDSAPTLEPRKAVWRDAHP